TGRAHGGPGGLPGKLRGGRAYPALAAAHPTSSICGRVATQEGRSLWEVVRQPYHQTYHAYLTYDDLERVAALQREALELDEAVRLNQAMHAPDRLQIRERDLMQKLARGPHEAVTQSADERLAERKALHAAARELFAARPRPTTRP